MTAPSVRHENRRRLLADTATLAGLTEPLVLGSGLDPDVARQRSTRRLFLVGDAKDTETAGRAVTARRLRQYGAALLSPILAGSTARLVLAIPPCSSRALAAWFELVQDATRLLPATDPRHVRIDADTTLVWVDLATTSRMSTT